MELTWLATTFLGIAGFITTLFYSKHSQKLAHEQMQKQLFTEFNERYSKLNDYLVQIESEGSTIELFEKHKDKDQLKQKVIDYFSLCAEEFYWYNHKERIDDIIWASWHSGMNYWYNQVPAIKELWKKEVAANGKESYYISNGKEFFIEK